VKTLALIADSPMITSGFAQPARMVVDAFVLDGTFDVAILGCLDTKVRDHRFLPYMYQPVSEQDREGYQITLAFLNAVRPDVIMMIGDPGALANRIKLFTMTGLRGLARSMCYFPVEGLPFQPAYASAVAAFDYPVTYCKFGADFINQKYNMHIDYVGHGADHGPFEQYDPGVREALRERIAWNDRFIIGMAGINKRGNRYPVLVQAMGILLAQGYDDIFMYLHTSPVDASGLQGWGLNWMIDEYQARDKYGKSHILFAPEYLEGGHIYRGVDYKLPVDKLLDMDVLEAFDGSPESRRAGIFSRMGYITRMNMLDMYIDVASVHGWNLPLSEAMKCGVAGATVDDGFARSEVYIQTEAAYPMQPSPVPDYWHTGAELKLVDVDVVVDTIKKFYHDSELRWHWAQRGKFYADTLKWQPMTDMFLEAAKKLA